MVASTPNAKKLNVAELIIKSEQGKRHINLVIIGHVDAGKSTLMGHMLHMLGRVDDKQMAKFARDSQRAGKSSFKYAWVLDADQEERDRGVTIDVAVSSFGTEHRQFTLLDAPGHADFIPNMISGASQADAAVLVVDAGAGEFEAGWGSDAGGHSQHGQTREHALLARSLGVSQIIIAVNKMDTVKWSQSRYDEICQQVGQYLVGCIGFKKSAIQYLPLSGMTGDNVVTRSQDAD